MSIIKQGVQNDSVLFNGVRPGIGAEESAFFFLLRAEPRHHVRGAETDLTLVTDATYTVRPHDGRFGVTVAITARNRTSDCRNAAPATVVCGNVPTANATFYFVDQVLAPAVAG